MTNSADDIPQSERRRIMAEERRMRTYHGHAQANIDEDRGGRFAFSGSPTTVTGASPISYPTQPDHSPWAKDACPPEPPLNIDINALGPTGEPHEIRASTQDQDTPPSPLVEPAAHGQADDDRGSVRPKGVRSI